jgi:hypothetical protein
MPIQRAGVRLFAALGAAEFAAGAAWAGRAFLAVFELATGAIVAAESSSGDGAGFTGVNRLGGFLFLFHTKRSGLPAHCATGRGAD